MEAGGGNPIGRVVDVFLIVLIIANGVAFAAETVNSVYQRWGPELEAFNTGDPGGAMYFIGSGEATVCVVPGKPIKLHEGDFFGEMALLEHRRQKHAVVADTVCRVYVLDSEGLVRLGRRHPEIVTHIKHVAKDRELENQRLRRTSRSPRAKVPAAAKNETEAQ